MTTRRVITFYGPVTEEAYVPLTLPAEPVAVTTSVMMVASIDGTRPPFSSINRDRGSATDQKRLLQAVLDTTGQGLSVSDGILWLVARNRSASELQPLPTGMDGLCTSYEDVMRYVSIRGEHGAADIDEILCQRVELAKELRPRRIEIVRSDGAVIEMFGGPMPGGGFVTI